MELKARCKERFEPVVQAIRQLQKEKEGLDEPLIVAIDGRCGSGKTTLGEYLEQVFDCNLFRMDDFFLRMEQRTPQRLKETGGNVDYERFEETVLRPIFQKQTVFYQPFSCRKWNLLEGYPVPYKKLNIIDCPGSDDFVGSTVTALNVTDTAIILLNGQYGVEVRTQNHFRYTEKLFPPVLESILAHSFVGFSGVQYGNL